MAEKNGQPPVPKNILDQEQEHILDLYIQSLDSYLDELKAFEKVQVEIETQHLKKILTK